MSGRGSMYTVKSNSDDQTWEIVQELDDVECWHDRNGVIRKHAEGMNNNYVCLGINIRRLQEEERKLHMIKDKPQKWDDLEERLQRYSSVMY